MKFLTISHKQTKRDDEEDIKQVQVFSVIKNYRQTLIYRIQREIRKKKKLQMKKRIQQEIDQKQRIKVQIMNKNMLNEEQQWDMIAEDTKKYQFSQVSDTTQTPLTKIQIAKDFIKALPKKPKNNLFMNQFQPFSYSF